MSNNNNRLFRPCINRNIVECKVISDFGEFIFDPVLIETLWNVK